MCKNNISTGCVMCYKYITGLENKSFCQSRGIRLHRQLTIEELQNRRQLTAEEKAADDS